ncbi:oligoendopeptidase F [Spiroplasma helicoides]|uniref:Oligoendopeptidase F n=1 Tax=Spiroplasma helicoides TaxID=216938 RepID=A0A1B3SKM3_9MOLU|nr:M3 family metallopeptidase [Spiroplasma helicoides]AOG60467.1 oligoendopeptidase F [Spiroplasma helicoides]
MQRKHAKNIYKWNLNKIYKGKKRFNKNLNWVIKENKKLIFYKNRLNNFKIFKKFFAKNEKINKVEDKILHYLKILEVDNNDKQAQEFESIYFNKMRQLDGMFTWVDEEIKNFDREHFLKLVINDKTLKPFYKTYLDFYENIKYLLPMHKRQLLSKVSNSSNILYEMYDTLMYKDNEFKEIFIGENKYELNNNKYNDIMTNSRPLEDQIFRTNVELLFKENLKNNKTTFLKIYESIIKNNIEYSKMINQEHYFDFYFDKKDFYKSQLNILFDVADKNKHLIDRYLKIYKNYFGFTDKFYYTDTSLRFATTNKHLYSVEFGKKVVKKSLKVLGKNYLKYLKKSLKCNLIDFYEDENKSSEAFTISSSNFDSLISMNWTDDIESIYTLAHEVGHSVHSKFSNKYQPKPLNLFSNLIAEISSTLNEHILSDYLLKKLESNQKINVLQNSIDFIIINFFSSIRNTKFELKAHDLVNAQQPLTFKNIKKILNEIDIKRDYLSDFDNQIKYYNWFDLSHIFDEPFYMYKYSVSIAVSYYLYNDFKKTKNSQKIISFLKEGGNLRPLELFEKYGFNCNDSKSYEPILKHLKDLISNLEVLLNINRN